MKKLFAFALLIASLSSCKKNSDTVATGSTDFSPLVKGTSWTYVRNSSDSAYKDSTYTFTVLDSTTIRSNKPYHVCSSSAGGNVYYALTDSGYFRAGSLLAGMGIPELATFEELYLSKSAAVGNTWFKILPITYQGTKYDLTLTYTIPSTGGTKTVLGKAYSNVLNVNLVMTAVLPFLGKTTLAAGDFYYAQGIGLINFSLKTTVPLQASVTSTFDLKSYIIK